MNYQKIFILIAFITLIGTLFTCFIRPKMHSKVFIYDSGYEIVEQNIYTPKIQQIPTQVQQSVQEKKEVKLSEKSKVEQKEFNNVEPKQEKVFKTNKVVPIQKQEKSENSVKLVQERIKQEEISWNIWRSNLQNAIMQNVDLPIVPKGTIFRFSFNVDKYGKISNIKVWSDTSTYTPYAIEYIAPVIRGFQGHSILNFPEGSTRTVTDVLGGWKISSTTKMSTPNDYNDSEVVTTK